MTLKVIGTKRSFVTSKLEYSHWFEFNSDKCVYKEMKMIAVLLLILVYPCLDQDQWKNIYRKVPGSKGTNGSVQKK